MSARDPEAILAELGHDLRAAWARPPRRRLLARWPRGLVLVLALLALVPTALATHDAIWAPDQAPLPDGGAAAGRGDARAGRRSGPRRARLERGVAWRLTASACDYGWVRAVGVFLTVPGGGGGARCDLASRRPGAGVSPGGLARRLVQTYFDPVAGRTWAFGALPAAARTVDVTSAGAGTSVAAEPADSDAVAKGGLPRGMRVFVAVLDGAHDVPLVTAATPRAPPLLVCREGRCAPPTPGGTP